MGTSGGTDRATEQGYPRSSSLIRGENAFLSAARSFPVGRGHSGGYPAHPASRPTSTVTE